MVAGPEDVDVADPDRSGVDVKLKRIAALDVMHAGDEFAARFLDAGEIGDTVAHLGRPGLLVDFALVQAASADLLEDPEIVEQIEDDVLWHETTDCHGRCRDR